MHLQYLKFWNTMTCKSAVTQKIKLPSTIGMLFLYVPAFLAAFISLVNFPLEGIAGNFYHHILLAHLRKKGEKEYKIPKGGLFGLVICPHCLFEIIGFVGFFLISRTLHAFFIAIGISFYLMGRSYATRRWYISKFENFPKDGKALIPSIL
ncbi:hypothetical protein FEM48_Zijuj03G0031900 [Ziziphus jujuba var. spinosa]|uniref:3-oxo-5-alpha-steroid 4-dehydrogenase C-terminal domain-containing protein n=1 Tax=Ziziphus jujuba var. spinosa TaxID=714518 RepID=A0A978VMU4_ZIZJJ|nr:hypothetical protein FEM48_Zijuj03G0031900 [Ziziphus jujuba var. spinosa]